MAFPIGKMPIQSTAGAITVRNEKGELTMEKVKVQRYVTGKRPDYAAEYSSEEEEGIDLPIGQQKSVSLPSTKTDAEKEDRRLRRLQDRHKEEESDSEDDDNDRLARHRRYHEPQVIAEGSSDEEEETAPHLEPLDESSEEEELDEDEIEQRRAMLRQKARAQQQEELLDVEEENVEEGSGEESSEYEEYTDSEEEEIEPRLRPVFVRKKDRATMLEREREAQKQRQAEIEAKHALEERRRQTIRMVHQTVRQDIEDERKAMTAQQGSNHEFENMGCTDDDNDEEEYEAWKVRELKRIKRDREEREQREREKQEIERLHNMTEEERRLELKNNPKLVTNKANKGKYKFLQKYYHRGAFFLDEEDEVFKRDVTAPTLEDHFDKTVQPKVMQVKNFGRSGRTKYTHLVDQDTTHFDSPWLDTAMSLKFHSTRAGGMKQGFEKPTAKRTNTTAM